MKTEEKLFKNIIQWDKKETKGVYIHIPFCKYICNYCDFCKKKIDFFNTEEYIELLLLEMNLSFEENENIFSNVKTIYIGGGTPSALKNSELKTLLKRISSLINMEDIEEFTIEANPDDIDKQFLDLLEKYNVTRLSMGVQSLNDSVLKKVGRGHKFHDIENALRLLQNYNFEVNTDFMFNLPGQTTDDIDKTFIFIEQYKEVISHISYYSLILEEHTVFYNKMIVEGLDEDEESDVYQKIQYELKKIGYNQYEISNFAKENKFSKHNFLYWNRSEYLGFGLSASSLGSEKRKKITQSYFKYKKYLDNRIRNKLFYEIDQLTKREQFEEQIFLGLRTMIGLPKNIFLDNKLNINDEYFYEKENRIILKKKYWFLSNTIIIDLLEEIENIYKGK